MKIMVTKNEDNGFHKNIKEMLKRLKILNVLDANKSSYIPLT